jgi:hypothetical protein
MIARCYDPTNLLYVVRKYLTPISPKEMIKALVNWEPAPEVGLYPIVTLEKQLLNLIEKLV